ncbi:MAG: DUF6377 domain-containing protein [Candidatus Cryptobacteroides sp.]
MKCNFCKKLFLALALFSGLVAYANDVPKSIEEKLRALDKAIEKADEYEQVRLTRIHNIEDELEDDNLDDVHRYNLYEQLYTVYWAYQYDSCLDVLEQMEALCRKMDKPSLLTDVLLKKALLLCKAGLFMESRQIVNEQIDTLSLNRGQLVEYYNYCLCFYIDYGEYLQNNGLASDLNRVLEYYGNRLLELANGNEHLLGNMRVRQLIVTRQIDKADSLNSILIRSSVPYSHEYAINTYYQAEIFELQDDTPHRIECLIESAVSDLVNAVKDNASLCCLAVELFELGDLSRAFKYMQTSLDDAIFFNSQLRPWQVSRSLPDIEKAYLASEQIHKKDMRSMLILAIVISLLLLASLIALSVMLRKQHNALSEVKLLNQKVADYSVSLEQSNNKLQQALCEADKSNRAKEEELALYLSMCSSYIGKLKKYLNRSEIEAELKYFYDTFDDAFLKIFPSFIDDFNALLKPEGRIVPHKGELLTTELRIFALIRLGITQSSSIASLLRYSVNTIYNYRAQVKNMALSEREDFEERIKNLGNSR